MSSWFKKPINIVIFALAVSLFIGAAVAIIVGVATHREPGFTQVCFDREGLAVYDTSIETGGVLGDGACEGFEELHWQTKEIPLTVAAVSADDLKEIPVGSDEREAIDSAVRDINSQVGFKLLTSVSNSRGAKIVVRMGEAIPINAGKTPRRTGDAKAPPKVLPAKLGYARHFRVGEHQYCRVGIYSLVPDLRGQYLVGVHEVLHCVGLAHDDDNPGSVMYPFHENETMWDRMNAARITDHDNEGINDRYNKATKQVVDSSRQARSDDDDDDMLLDPMSPMNPMNPMNNFGMQ